MRAQVLEARTFGMSAAELAELSNLWHLSKTALGDGASTYDRKLWATKHFHEAHPHITSTAAYKVLSDSPWIG